uniref:Uncharacterized protein n=1 Tax=Sinocyclocheilus anshuiensis TaxID=1608454 RepID=A0A671T7T8_9TELE
MHLWCNYYIFVSIHVHIYRKPCAVTLIQRMQRSKNRLDLCTAADAPLLECTAEPQPSGVITVPFLQRLSSFSSQVMVFFSVLFFSFSFSYFFFHCSAVSSTFTHTVFVKTLSVCISHHLCPNMSVVLVSASL